MAFDPHSTSRRYYLAIHLDGLDLYVGQEAFALSDGTTVAGLVAALSPLSRSAGSLEDPRLELPSMQVSLNNRPDQTGERVQDLLDQYEWANRQVDLWVGHDTDPADYELIWAGRVKFPADATFDDDQVTIRLVDARAADARYLPVRLFDADSYPNAEASALTLPIPLVYGDWTSTAGSGLTLPAYQIDATEGTGGRWKIADHALAQLEAVYRNGASVAFTADLDDGEFVLNVAYTPGTDTVTVHCQGATDDATSGGQLLATAPDVFRDLIVLHLGVDPSAVDDAALIEWGGRLSSADRVRRWIGGQQVSSDELIAQLLRDTFADLTVAGGAYSPRYRGVVPSASVTAITEGDLLTDGQGPRRVFSVARNPDTVYANEVAASYEWDPVAGRYTGRYIAEDLVAIATKGIRVRRTLEMPWRYLAQGARDRADTEAYAFSGDLELVSLAVGPIAMATEPADQIEVVYSKYDQGDGTGVRFQVRQIESDPSTWSVSVVAWNLWRLTTGTWTEDDTVTWLTATPAQRTQKGFWSDGNGYADSSASPDAASQRYRWL